MDKSIDVDTVYFDNNNRKINTTITATNINSNRMTFALISTVKGEYGNNVNEGFLSVLVDNRTLKDEKGNVIYTKVKNGVASYMYTLPDSWKKTNHTYYMRIIQLRNIE